MICKCPLPHHAAPCPRVPALFQDTNGAPLDLTPAEALKTAVEAATFALDRAKADGLTVPPQAAAGVAVLDTTALMLERQIRIRP